MAIARDRPDVELPGPPYWTIEDFDRAVDAGVFGDRRVELISGAVYELPPMNDRHAGAVRYLQVLFFRALGERALSQTPIILPHDGEPEADVGVVAADAPPRPPADQVDLVIEVSDSERRRQYDRGAKLEAYLRDEVAEIWIIDLVERVALVYRGGVLFGRFPQGSGAQLVAERVPEVTVNLDAVFAAAGQG